MSRWLLDFVAGPGDGTAAGIAGFVRLDLREAEPVAQPAAQPVVWYWAYLVGIPDADGVLVVRDHEVLPPRRTDPRRGLEIRADGLWAELTCETPREHWTFGLESFGVRLDAAGDALRPGGEVGERVAIGLDLEWEVGDGGPPAGIVHGDVLVGRARHAVDGRGWFYDAADPDPEAVDGEVLATVLVPGDDEYVERRLVSTASGPRWSLTRHEYPRRARPARC